MTTQVLIRSWKWL